MRLLVTFLVAGFLSVTAGIQAVGVEAIGGSGSWKFTADNYYHTTVNGLDGVAAVSTSDVWAVGEYGESDGLNITPKTLTEHYTVW